MGIIKSSMQLHSHPTSYRPISLISLAAKVLEALILPTLNAHLHPAPKQHGFRPGHYTTSALLNLTADITSGFNQKKPPHQTACVAVNLTVAFDTVCHNTLISKIVSIRSLLLLLLFAPNVKGE